MPIPPDTESGFPYGRSFHEALPRDEKRMDGHNLFIVAVAGRTVSITDGERTADYEPLGGERDLDMENVRIKPADIEPGVFGEANVVTLTDDNRVAVYVPVGSQTIDDKPT